MLLSNVLRKIKILTPHKIILDNWLFHYFQHQLPLPTIFFVAGVVSNFYLNIRSASKLTKYPTHPQFSGAKQVWTLLCSNHSLITNYEQHLQTLGGEAFLKNWVPKLLLQILCKWVLLCSFPMAAPVPFSCPLSVQTTLSEKNLTTYGRNTFQ